MRRTAIVIWLLTQKREISVTSRVRGVNRIETPSQERWVQSSARPRLTFSRRRGARRHAEIPQKPVEVAVGSAASKRIRRTSFGHTSARASVRSLSDTLLAAVSAGGISHPGSKRDTARGACRVGVRASDQT